MWALKKVVSRLLFPVPLCLEILLLGIFLLWFTKRQRTGKVLVTLGALLLALVSSGPVSRGVLAPIEYQYPALHDPTDPEATGTQTPVGWVVVLAGGCSPDPALSLSARPTSQMLARLLEGARLQRRLPGSKLVVSIEQSDQADEIARTLTEVISMLGVPEEHLHTVSGARDTSDEVDLIRRVVVEEPFILVTSAAHLPRAVALFQAAGLSPIPAPTDYVIRTAALQDPAVIFPSAEHLRDFERAYYEHLGRAWARIGGR